MKFAIVSSHAPHAVKAEAEIKRQYNVIADFDQADAIIVLGGDGTMLGAMHTHMDRNVPIYGMNRGSVGFLMNDYDANNLELRVQHASETEVNPLRVTGRSIDGDEFSYLAFNDASLTRETGQAIKLEISVDGKVKLDELIGDGLIISTPVGSTAYNRSAGGPILPLEAPLLALTPICAFRPRYWKGAIVPDTLAIEVNVLEADRRYVMLAADSQEQRKVSSIRVLPELSKKARILCDPGRSWSDKLLNDQFYG